MPQIIDLAPPVPVDPRIGPPSIPGAGIIPARPETASRPAAQNYEQLGPKPDFFADLFGSGLRTAIGRQIQGPERINLAGDVNGQQLGFGNRGGTYINGQPYGGDPSNLYEFARFQQDQQANSAEQDYLGQYRRGVLDNQGRDALRDQQIYDQSSALFPIRQQREQAGLFNTQNTIDVRNQRLAMTREDRELKRRIDEQTRAAGSKLNRTALGILGPQLGLSGDDADALSAVADEVSPEQFNSFLTQYRLSRENGSDGREVTEAANKAWSQAVEDRFVTQTDEITDRIKQIDAALEPLRAEIDLAESAGMVNGRKAQAPEGLLRKSRELRTEKAGLLKKMSRLTTRSMYRWRSGYPRSLAQAAPIIGEDIGVRIAQQIAQEVSEELGVPVDQMTPEQQAEVQARTEQALSEMGWKP